MPSCKQLFHRISSGEQSSVDCPTDMKLDLTNCQGQAATSLVQGVFTATFDVPAGAVAAYVGYKDSAYFDNEGRRTPSNSTGGCHFKIEVKTVCP